MKTIARVSDEKKVCLHWTRGDSHYKKHTSSPASCKRIGCDIIVPWVCSHGAINRKHHPLAAIVHWWLGQITKKSNVVYHELRTFCPLRWSFNSPAVLFPDSRSECKLWWESRIRRKKEESICRADK